MIRHGFNASPGDFSQGIEGQTMEVLLNLLF
jgi:hypothetical protein